MEVKQKVDPHYVPKFSSNIFLKSLIKISITDNLSTYILDGPLSYVFCHTY